MKILSIMMIDAETFRPPTSEDMERMGEFIQKTRSQGVLIDTGGAMDGMLEMKISSKNGKHTVTDGPFTEGKEFVGGYALLEVAGRDEAVEFVKQFLDVVHADVTCHLHEVTSI